MSQKLKFMNEIDRLGVKGIHLMLDSVSLLLHHVLSLIILTVCSFLTPVYLCVVNSAWSCVCVACLNYENIYLKKQSCTKSTKEPACFS